MEKLSGQKTEFLSPCSTIIEQTKKVVKTWQRKCKETRGKKILLNILTGKLSPSLKVFANIG